ncbi:cytochrome c oxidase assembly protein [Luteimonas lutimaris]|uniref:Cytochrome c oxidase assembly protein CtaG n=1 Tax=Luteimonas lutimaris TaxID=698645 RepID=A0ABP7MME1_9GAMM|nr:cytochrome c oxidase assembly protein [Luteimonas sp.]
MSGSGDGQKAQGRGTAKMVGVAIAAFAFTFSLVPLYRVACEKVFGIRVENAAIGSDRAVALGAGKSDRVITVQFDGGVNSKLPWSFHPEQVSMKVRPGEQYDTTFYARNDGKRAIVGNAVPSIAPARASGYFSKTECFCFTAQTLQAGEARDMPVRFIIAPDLPEEIHTITLSYTFFKNNELTAQLGAAGSATASRAAP